MKLSISLLTIALAASVLHGQANDHYMATATTTALTVQQPASNARLITFGGGTVPGASVSCAAAQTATLSWGGAAATATAGAEKLVLGTFIPSGATVWTASNVGAGISGPVYNIAAGGTVNIDLSWFRLGTQGTTQNVTITTSGSCTITFFYSAS